MNWWKQPDEIWKTKKGFSYYSFSTFIALLGVIVLFLGLNLAFWSGIESEDVFRNGYVLIGTGIFL